MAIQLVGQRYYNTQVNILSTLRTLVVGESITVRLLVQVHTYLQVWIHYKHTYNYTSFLVKSNLVQLETSPTVSVRCFIPCDLHQIRMKVRWCYGYKALGRSIAGLLSTLKNIFFISCKLTTHNMGPILQGKFPSENYTADMACTNNKE